MIRLPDGHNTTGKRFARSMQDAFADSRYPCIERPMPRAWNPWVLFGPIAVTVAVLALVNVVTQRNEERKAFTRACEAEQIEHDGNPAACRYLLLLGGR